MLPAPVIEAAAIEIGPVVSFEIWPVVGEVNAVAVVTVPGWIVIIGISGEIGLACGGRCIVAAVIFRRGGRRIGITVNNGGGNGGGYNDSRSGNPEADAGAYVYLGIAFGRDEAGGYNGGEHQYLFHICSFKFSDAG